MHVKPENLKDLICFSLSLCLLPPSLLKQIPQKKKKKGIAFPFQAPKPIITPGMLYMLTPISWMDERTNRLMAK